MWPAVTENLTQSFLSEEKSDDQDSSKELFVFYKHF